MNRAWIALAALAILALLTLSPHTVAPLLALGYPSQRTEPGWVAIPPETRIFSVYEDTQPIRAARSGRLDLFSNLPLQVLRAFCEKDLAERGFTVGEESMGNITPAARKSDGAAMIVSFASEHGLLRKSRLFNIVWRIAAR